MNDGEWMGLDELGRGAAQRLDVPVRTEGGGSAGVCRGERATGREGAAAANGARTVSHEDAADRGEDGVEAALAALEARVGRLSDQFETRIKKSDYEDAMLKRLSDELDEHRNDLYRKIVEPLINEVISMHEGMTRTVMLFRRKAGEEGLSGIAGELKYAFEEYWKVLGDILRTWNVEVWSPAVGDEMEPGRCRAVRGVPTDDKARHRTVAEVVTPCYLLDGKVLSAAQVAAYAYKPTPVAKEAGDAPLSSSEAAAAVAQAVSGGKAPRDPGAFREEVEPERDSAPKPQSASVAVEPDSERGLESEAETARPKPQPTVSAVRRTQAGAPAAIPPAPPAPPASEAGDHVSVA